MKVYNLNISLDNFDSNLKVEIEGEMMPNEYNSLIKTMNSVPRPEFELVTKGYVDQLYNKTVKKEFKPGRFGGCFNIDGTKVYITKVIYNKPVVVVFWSDGVKTRSTCHKEDIWNPEMGLLLNVMKRFTSTEQINMLYADWGITSEVTQKTVTLKDVRQNYKEEKELKTLRDALGLKK